MVLYFEDYPPNGYPPKESNGWGCQLCPAFYIYYSLSVNKLFKA